VNPKLQTKLDELPKKPGVYLMRDRNGRVIYVGKAKSLRSRVRNYFQKGTLRSADPKLRGLIKSIEDLDIIVVHNEAEAVLSEGRLIKEYRPRYNVAFKDDKRFMLLTINPDEPLPRLRLGRIQRKDSHRYFGPYASANSTRSTKDFVERRYGLRQCRAREPGEHEYKHCMADIIRTCSAPCVGKISPEAYRERVDEASAFLRGERPDVLKELQEQMEAASEKLKFEKAAQLRDTLLTLRRTVKQRASGTSSRAFHKDRAAEGIQELQRVLTLPTVPKVIETFDISNISGTYSVASMVCAVDGLPRPQRYRRFRIKTIEGPNDPAMMGEAVERRYKRLRDENLPMPDLIVLDGGITQLRAGRAKLDELGLEHVPAVGLAKRFEEIVWDVTNLSPAIRLPMDSNALQVLQRIRDEAHRFALTYHRKLREKRIRASRLDEIEGIGDKRKEILLAHFGSVDRMKKASLEELEAVKGIGKKYAQILKNALQ